MRLLLVALLLAQAAWGQPVSLSFDNTPLRHALQTLAESLHLNLELLDEPEGFVSGTYLGIPPQEILRRVLTKQTWIYRIVGRRLVVGSETTLDAHEPLEVPPAIQELEARAQERLSLCVALGANLFYLEFFTDGEQAGWMHGLTEAYPWCGFARQDQLYGGDTVPLETFRSLRAAFEQLCWTADLPPVAHPEPGVWLVRCDDRWLAARTEADAQLKALLRKAFAFMMPADRSALQREFRARGPAYRSVAALLGGW